MKWLKIKQSIASQLHQYIQWL